jgi:hypothetical protein
MKSKNPTFVGFFLTGSSAYGLVFWRIQEPRAVRAAVAPTLVSVSVADV